MENEGGYRRGQLPATPGRPRASSLPAAEVRPQLRRPAPSPQPGPNGRPAAVTAARAGLRLPAAPAPLWRSRGGGAGRSRRAGGWGVPAPAWPCPGRAGQGGSARPRCRRPVRCGWAASRPPRRPLPAADAMLRPEISASYQEVRGEGGVRGGRRGKAVVGPSSPGGAGAVTRGAMSDPGAWRLPSGYTQRCRRELVSAPVSGSAARQGWPRRCRVRGALAKRIAGRTEPSAASLAPSGPSASAQARPSRVGLAVRPCAFTCLVLPLALLLTAG